MKKIGIGIHANAGYSAEQVKCVTLGELKDFIEELLEYNDESTEIFTVDSGNIYGAKYGEIYLDVVAYDNDEDEED